MKIDFKSRTTWIVIVVALVLVISLTLIFTLGRPGEVPITGARPQVDPANQDAPGETAAANLLASVPSVGGEQPIILIPLAGPIDDPNAEISGLAWFGDTLILLPQYPERFGNEAGAVFAIPKAEILAFLDGTSSEPITPALIPFYTNQVSNTIPSFQGFESIGFLNEEIYVTVEAGQGAEMTGYLLRGTILPDLSEITLDVITYNTIPQPIQVENHSDEALIITDTNVITFYEVNGVGLNPQPVAHLFNHNLTLEGTIPFPSIEYRITDATVDSEGVIWAINYFYPGDTNLFPELDPLAEAFGQGETHAVHEQVERIISLDYSPNGFTLADRPPIQLQLVAEDARNWEGLVALDTLGFLLATDKYPGTLLAFVPKP
ncbi:MAG: hypothetical protein JXB85_06230 [Anaerolineales bacterium]|nr:hypothetical protein [Anaerolineales bacterium]